MRRIDYKDNTMFGDILFKCESNPRWYKGRSVRVGLFKCYCGNYFYNDITKIKTGVVKSCGCLMIETTRKSFTKHGLSKHPLYLTWKSMKTRCYNKACDSYKYYGGRGIEVSDEFKISFKLWLEHVIGLDRYNKKDELKLTMDRIDNNKGYERGNLRWATKIEQMGNQRKRGTCVVL